jgi:hypothetical protein
MFKSLLLSILFCLITSFANAQENAVDATLQNLQDLKKIFEDMTTQLKTSEDLLSTKNLYCQEVEKKLNTVKESERESYQNLHLKCEQDLQTLKNNIQKLKILTKSIEQNMDKLSKFSKQK